MAEATKEFNGVALMVVSYPSATYWSVDKDGTMIEGEADDIDTAQCYALAACTGLLALFDSLARLKGGRVTPVNAQDED